MAHNRQDRLADAAAQRMGWVRCAVEHVHHRHNASAILRTCDALGIHHVHLIGEERFQPSKGPSLGAWRWLELHRHDDTASAIAALRSAGVQLWVADLADTSHAPADLPIDQPVCLWFGAEMMGVSEEARAAADGVVTIPMRGFAQSLNVSVAAALALHVVGERARARHGQDALLPATQREALLASWLARETQELEEAVVEARASALLGARLGDD